VAHKLYNPQWIPDRSDWRPYLFPFNPVHTKNQPGYEIPDAELRLFCNPHEQEEFKNPVRHA
jgi:hypothetical protein